MPWTWLDNERIPDSKIHWANMGPIWCRQDPGGPHVGPMNIAIWDSNQIDDGGITYAISLLVLWRFFSSQLRFGNNMQWNFDNDFLFMKTNLQNCDHVASTTSRVLKYKKTDDDFGTSNIKDLSNLGSYHQTSKPVPDNIDQALVKIHYRTNFLLTRGLRIRKVSRSSS